MRKSSSFMCVLVVLLAGGAEAQRPLAKEALGLVVLGLPGAQAWVRDEGCKKFSEIYADGKELIEVMWNDAFTYEPDESKGYTIFWYEPGVESGVADPNSKPPNNAVTEALGFDVPGQCHLDYFHKDVPTPETDDFTECHPWHSEACCHNTTVLSPAALSEAYGPGYEWDRCGPLSPACERFFVNEACLYECDVNAGLYTKFTDEQHVACQDAEEGDTVTLASGGTYKCTGAENEWQMYKMPIKASVADAWFRACYNDYFIGSGDYFGSAASYHKQLEEEAARAAEIEAARLKELSTVEGRLRAQEKLVAEIQAQLDEEHKQLEEMKKAAGLVGEDEKEVLPVWAIVVIALVSTLAVAFLIFIGYMYFQEKKGMPVFTNMANEKQQDTPVSAQA